MEAQLPERLARTLSWKRRSPQPTPLRALRRFDVTRTRHRIGQYTEYPAFPVPGGVAHITTQKNSPLPDIGDFPAKV